MTEKRNKSALARAMGVSRASLYYVARQHAKDWGLKIRMEEVLQEHPSYGSRRLAIALGLNRKRTKRVMKIFGIKPYRRRGRRYRKSKKTRVFPNLLLGICPSYENHVWAADFTEMVQHGKKAYTATIIDLFTRQTMGVHVGTRKGSALTIQALANALLHHPKPTIFHSDNGKEYEAKAFIGMVEEWGITISRSRPGCPWENGYQESFYDKLKVDFGDPNRFKTLGEMVAAIYRTIWEYNHTRIHSALKMPPAVFAKKMAV